MKPEPVDELLRSLPRAEPSEGFTSRVMERLDERTPRRVSPWLAATAAAGLLVAVLGAADHIRDQRNERARVAALRSETLALSAELEQLKEMTPDPGSVMWIGGTDDVDVYIELAAAGDDSAAVRVGLAELPPL